MLYYNITSPKLIHHIYILYLYLLRRLLKKAQNLHVITYIEMFCNCRRRFLMLWDDDKIDVGPQAPASGFCNIERFLTKTYTTRELFMA